MPPKRDQRNPKKGEAKKGDAKKKMIWKMQGSEEASEQRDCNWDEPLPSSITTATEEATEYSDEVQRKDNLARLDMYVARMAYIPAPPPPPPKHIKRTENLARPKRFALGDNYEYFSEFYEPPERSERMKALTAGFRTMPPEEFEQHHKAETAKKKRKANIAKRKEQIFYELSAKLEKQSRSQYLNALIHKFAEFVADMATTMNIPPQLNEPYARMQRGIFYNIVCALGIQPPTQAAYYYNTQDAIEYETIHKCAHAMLCLIIKALDAAAMKDPNEIPPMDREPDMDTYIKERLMAAAMKKLVHIEARKPYRYKTCLEETLSKCQKFGDQDPCVDL